MSKWRETTFDQIIEIMGGGTPRTNCPEYWNGSIPWLSVTDFNTGFRWVNKSEKTITEKGLHESSTTLLKSGDIILSARGTVGVIAQLGKPMAFNQSCYGIRGKQGISDTDFIYFALKQLISKMQQLAHGAVFNTITRSTFEMIKLYLPPLPEQKAIARILGSLDDKIELNRRMNETLEAMARAIFKDWFVDFGPTRAKMEGRTPYLPEPIWSLFPEAIDPLSGLPIGWENATLNHLIQFNPSENLKKGVKAPYLGMNALPTQGSIPDPPTLREFTSGMRFRNGDTLFARITPCLENGKTAFIQNLTPSEIGWGSTEFIVMRSIPPVPKVFTYLIARDPSFRTTAIQSMTGTSGRQRVRIEALQNHIFCKPQNEIWECLDSILNPLFDKVASHNWESLTLAELRDRLLPKLMSGEIRVKDAERLVEEVL